MLANVDPMPWVKAVREVVDTFPYGNTILLCTLGVLVTYFGLVPLIRAVRNKP